MVKHRICAVDKDSIAEEAGIRAGDFLCAINGENVEDVIDYESLTAEESVLLCLETAEGEVYEAEIEKDAYEPLGLNFASGLMSTLRPCKNRCIFCFIDQLPKGGRETLHVKDDDWRLSLIMGNYITLTNVDDAEFERIIKRRVSPLYISVHASDGAVRKRMMGNPSADRLMGRLARLKAEGLQFDAQIVLCPGVNDGTVLERTLEDLYALRPAARSLAVVPVGLTRYRDNLFPLRPLTKEEAGEAIDLLESYAQKSQKDWGDAFAYASDEMYIIAARALPDAASYGEYPQLENGVGLLRNFEEGFMQALQTQKPRKKPLYLDAASGISAAPFLRALFAKLAPYHVYIHVHAVPNRHFGENVTVSGLLCGADLLAHLAGHIRGEALLLPQNMLREHDDHFLDGYTLAALQAELGHAVFVMPAADGGAFIERLFALEL